MVRIYGRMRSANGYAIRDFLHRCDIPFEWIELGSDKEAEELAHVQRLSDSMADVDDMRVTHSFGKTSFLGPGYVDVPT